MGRVFVFIGCDTSAGGREVAESGHLEIETAGNLKIGTHWVRDWDWVTQASPKGDPGVTQGPPKVHARVE